MNNADEAAYFTILAIKEIAINLKKSVKTVAFKKQHYILFKRITEMLNLEDRFIIEEKIKITSIVKHTGLPNFVKS